MSNQQTLNFDKPFSFRNENCAKCTRSSNMSCKTICVIGDVSRTYDLMVVSFQPSETANNLGIPSVDAGNQIINYALKNILKFDLDNIYYTSLLKCYSQYPHTDLVEQSTQCVSYLEHEVKKVKPKAIICIDKTKEHFIRSFMVDDCLFSTPVYFVDAFSVDSIESNARFKTLLTSLEQAVLKTYDQLLDKSAELTQYVICKTITDIELVCDYVEQTGYASFDIETTGLIFWSDKLLTLSITFQAGSAYVIPFEHAESTFTKDEYPLIFSLLTERIFNNNKIIKMGWNVKFDLKFLSFYGVKSISGRYYDGLAMAHLIDENNMEKGLKKVGTRIFNEFKDYQVDAKTLEDKPLDYIAKYNANDTDLTYRTVLVLEQRLMKDPLLYSNFRNIVVPATTTLFKMEEVGMVIDKPLLEESIELIDKRIIETEEQLQTFKQVKKYVLTKNNHLIISELQTLREKRDSAESRNRKADVKRYEQKIADLKAGVTVLYERVNFSSVPQLKDLLYSKDGFELEPLIDYDGNQVFSTDQATVTELKDSTGFVDMLLLYRKLTKLQSTYLIGIKERLDNNNKLHASFSQTGTVTGRLSCKDPNLQNIPRGDETSAIVKRVFSVPTDYTMVCVDYSQVELRLVALFSKDPEMINAYAHDQDLHTLTAKNTLNVSNDDWDKLDAKVKKTYRTSAKAINFGFIYGMSADKFKDYAYQTYAVEMTLKEAQQIRTKFFNLYGKLLVWHDTYRNKAYKDGFVRTLFGRKRNLPNIYDDGQPIKKSEAQRQAVNSPIQGTAGELTVFTACILHKCLPKDVYLVNSVHDSLMFYVPTTKVGKVATLIKYLCEHPPVKHFFDFTFGEIPLIVDVETGSNWKDVQPLEFNVT